MAVTCNHLFMGLRGGVGLPTPASPDCQQLGLHPGFGRPGPGTEARGSPGQGLAQCTPGCLPRAPRTELQQPQNQAVWGRGLSKAPPHSGSHGTAANRKRRGGRSQAGAEAEVTLGVSGATVTDWESRGGGAGQRQPIGRRRRRSQEDGPWEAASANRKTEKLEPWVSPANRKRRERRGQAGRGSSCQTGHGRGHGHGPGALLPLRLFLLREPVRGSLRVARAVPGCAAAAPRLRAGECGPRAGGCGAEGSPESGARASGSSPGQGQAGQRRPVHPRHGRACVPRRGSRGAETPPHSRTVLIPARRAPRSCAAAAVSAPRTSSSC